MNQVFTRPPHRQTTQAADGLPRWHWTVAEIERMAAAGIFHEDEKFELIGGEIVPMSPRGRKHEIIRGRLAFHYARISPPGVFVIAEAQFNLTDDTYVNPDILVHPASIVTPDVRGRDALLVIEVANSSLGIDLHTKAMVYAAHGVREYWVVNARTMVTAVFDRLQGAAYAKPRRIGKRRRLVPTLVPDLAVSLIDIDAA